MTPTTSNRLRVLLLAEACNPTWTSVPLVGYNIARALAERPDLDVTLVSHVRNREALLADPIAARATLSFIDNEHIARPFYLASRVLRGGKALSWTTATAMGWPAYMAFENQVANRFGRALDGGRFDLVHRVTPVSPTLSSPLASRTRMPMILGPLNGGLPWPADYPELRRQEREWLVPLRGLYKLLPYFASTYRHAAAVIAGSRHTAGEVPKAYRGRRYLMAENGVDPARFPIAEGWTPPAGRFRFVTVGRLVPYKGADLILEAMAGSKVLRECELLVIGDGPQRAALEGQAQAAGLADRVRFAGWLEQVVMGRELRGSQAFVFPSLREFGGGVVLEAMSAGLPSVIVDYGGPAELVTPECGVLLPMQPRQPLVARLREAMERLAGDADACRSMGRHACELVRDEFTWEAKASRLSGIYRDVVGSGAKATPPAVCESSRKSIVGQ
jgi:glycosyltransferase involved in cell wall biosynthesis